MTIDFTILFHGEKASLNRELVYEILVMKVKEGFYARIISGVVWVFNLEHSMSI